MPVIGQDDADRLAVGVALLARAAAAPETLSEGQVLSATGLPQALCRVQKLYALCMDGDACDIGIG